MRRCQYVVQRLEGVRRRQRLSVEYVDRRIWYFFIGIHPAAIDSASDGGSVYQSSVCCSRFDIRLRAPFERQEEVGGWESFFQGNNEAIRSFGFLELLFNASK